MESPKKFFRIDKDALDLLRPLAAQAGVEIPGLIQFQPTLDMDVTVTELAGALGGLCSRQPIFRQADNLVALDDEGVLRAMTPDRLGSWVEKFVTTRRYTKDRGEHAATMPKDLAAKVMVTDCFIAQVRKLSFFFPVRLPVQRPDGTVELLEPGYDDQTESWTEDGIVYPDDVTWDGAMEVFQEILGEWPYADLMGKDRVISQSRDAAVIMGALLGVFCRPMFGPGQKRPMVVVSGNQPGTGKSTLCKIIMAAVFGMPAEMSLPPTEEKFERMLEAIALGMEPYLFLDDVGRMMKSNALNKFVTATNHGGTRLYTQAQFKVPNVTQVFVTGNDLPIEGNIKRRVMWCELFLPGEVQGRKFTNEITDNMLGKDSFRAKLLGAMWAVVKEWAAQKAINPKLGKDRKILKSFEHYCHTVGSIMEVMSWRDPFEEPLGISGGDEEGRDFKMLLTAVADKVYLATQEFTTKDMIDKAREMKVLEWLVGSEGDPDLMKKEKIRWGKKLAEWRGRIFQRTDGNFFEFGKRDGKGGSVYPCRIANTIEELM